MSIASQVDELQEVARSRGFTIGAVLTESQSAKSPGRPVFAQLMEQVHRDNHQGVLCWKLDRLARNPVDGGALIWALDAGTITEIVTPDRVFENTGNDKFWMQLEFGIAKKYVDDLSDNVRRGNRAKLEQGWLPGMPPMGYLNDRLARTIIPDPERFPLMRRAWELLLEGIPPSHAYRTLTDDWGLRTRRTARTGGKMPSRSSFYRLLSNPFYYGVIIRGDDVYRGAHVPLVTKTEFDQVQAQLRRPRGHRHRPQFRYTQLITCRNCGCSITAEEHLKPSGRCYRYYHCSRRKQNVHCAERALPEPLLEQKLLGYVARITIDRRYLAWVLKHRPGLEARRRFATSLQSTQKTSLRHLRSQQDRLLDLRLREFISDEEYVRQKSMLAASICALQEQLASLPARLGNPAALLDLSIADVLLTYLREADAWSARGLLSLLGTFVLGDQRLDFAPYAPLRLR
jgi:DNA invertase Pin-like site-specific DNA recombinase